MQMSFCYLIEIVFSWLHGCSCCRWFFFVFLGKHRFWLVHVSNWCCTWGKGWNKLLGIYQIMIHSNRKRLENCFSILQPNKPRPGAPPKVALDRRSSFSREKYDFLASVCAWFLLLYYSPRRTKDYANVLSNSKVLLIVDFFLTLV